MKTYSSSSTTTITKHTKMIQKLMIILCVLFTLVLLYQWPRRRIAHDSHHRHHHTQPISISSGVTLPDSGHETSLAAEGAVAKHATKTAPFVTSTDGELHDFVSLARFTLRPHYNHHQVSPDRILTDTWTSGRPSVQNLRDGLLNKNAGHNAGLSFLLVTGERPSPCKSRNGAHSLLQSYKNKVDYCTLHGCKVWYMLETWEEGFKGVWARYPALLRLMQSLPSVPWFMWMDADAIFTDFNFTIPFKQYEEWNKNFIAHGFHHLLYGKKGNWFGLNAGVFLIRNCEWSYEFLKMWRVLGTPEMRVEARRAFNHDITNRPPSLPADDQSALVYLLRKTRNVTETRVHMEAAYYLHGYWQYMVDRYEDMVAKGREESLDDEKWPFTTHFCGCSFCTAANTPSFNARCRIGFRRAYNFGDNQFLEAIGARLYHPNFNTSSLVPLPESSAGAGTTTS